MSVTHFIFVDFENVPGIALEMLADGPVVVTLVLGTKNKLKADLIAQVTGRPFEIRVVKAGRSGKNAVDFVLACHLGATAARNPSGHFHVISKDNDFNALISHLRANGLAIAQHAALESLPPHLLKKAAAEPTPAPAVKKPAGAARKTLETRREKIRARLANPESRNRPSTREALQSHLVTALGKDGTAAKAREFIADLVEGDLVRIDKDNRVTYPNGLPG